MEVIGADGVHVGTVDHVEGDRIKLTKKDSGEGQPRRAPPLHLDRPDRRRRGRQGAAQRQRRRRGDVRGRSERVTSLPSPLWEREGAAQRRGRVRADWASDCSSSPSSGGCAASSRPGGEGICAIVAITPSIFSITSLFQKRMTRKPSPSMNAVRAASRCLRRHACRHRLRSTSFADKHRISA